MVISEIFHSLQGEGILVGTPSVFVRTAGCNLRCTWCDTPYASWDPKGEEMTVDQIVAEVTRYRSRHCVLTGGEPMIAPGIRDLAASLSRRKIHLTIETAGTVAPEGVMCNLASLSPKLSNSRPVERASDTWLKRHDRDRIQPEIIDQWLADYSCQLKFVITSESDIAEIHDLFNMLSVEIDPSHVLLIPEGVTSEQLHRHTDTIMKLCAQYGYRYGSRLHIDLFGNTRGT